MSFEHTGQIISEHSLGSSNLENFHNEWPSTSQPIDKNREHPFFVCLFAVGLSCMAFILLRYIVCSLLRMVSLA